MGYTHYFTFEAPARGDAAAVEECLYEFGHDSYNGTLSTCQLVGELQGAKNVKAYYFVGIAAC